MSDKKYLIGVAGGEFVKAKTYLDATRIVQDHMAEGFGLNEIVAYQAEELNVELQTHVVLKYVKGGKK